MIKCMTCSKAIFDPLWGDTKCSVYEHTMYYPSEVENCPEYKEGTPAESKNQDEYKALRED